MSAAFLFHFILVWYDYFPFPCPLYATPSNVDDSYGNAIKQCCYLITKK